MYLDTGSQADLIDLQLITHSSVMLVSIFYAYHVDATSMTLTLRNAQIQKEVIKFIFLYLQNYDTFFFQYILTPCVVHK